MFTAKVWSAAAVAAICASVPLAVLAADSIKTRSPDAAQADLMRDWNAKPSAQPGSTVRSRNEQDANADLMRDFNAKASNEPGASFEQRSPDAAHKDLVRDWSPDRPAPAHKTVKKAQ